MSSGSGPIANEGQGSANSLALLTPQPVREVVMLPYLTPPKSGGLYVIRLSDTHYYGGITKNFRVRWYEHYRSLRNGTHKNPHAQAVFNQHRQFNPMILDFIEDPVARVAAEQAWLDKHFKDPSCLNIVSEAEGPPMEGRTHSETSKRKMATRKKGFTLSPEHRQSLSDAQKHRHDRDGVSLATRAKISRALRGRQRPDTAERNRVRAGWTHSAEALEKISAAGRVGGFKGKSHSAETKAKISSFLKGRTPSEETLRKRSESLKRAWAARKSREGT